MQAMGKGVHLKDVCASSESISSIFDGDQLEELFDPRGHLGVSGEIVDNAISIARGMMD